MVDQETEAGIQQMSQKSEYPDDKLGTQPHRLHTVTVTQQLDARLSGSFFFFGHIAGRAQTKQVLYFAWEITPQEYQMSHVDINKVRVKLDGSRPPVITFHHRHDSANSRGYVDTQALIDRLQWVTVHCCDADWPPTIRLP